MTEAEWLVCTEPKPMLDYLTTQGKASERRLRLFACATARIVENHDTHKEWVDVVEACELFADGKSSKFGSGGYGLLTAAKSIDSVYGWLWAATRLTISGAINETLHVAAGVAGKFSNGRVADALREIFGNPFRSVEIPCVMRTRNTDGSVTYYNCPWFTPTVLSIAQAAYSERSSGQGSLDGDRLLVLADALEDAGCMETSLSAHLRDSSPHYQGCWVLDILLGKE